MKVSSILSILIVLFGFLLASCENPKEQRIQGTVEWVRTIDNVRACEFAAYIPNEGHLVFFVTAPEDSRSACAFLVKGNPVIIIKNTYKQQIEYYYQWDWNRAISISK